jgi:hypothetical protein
LWTLSPPFFVTHVATCPHRPVAMRVLWSLSPQYSHPLHVPHRPRGYTVFCGTPITRRRCCRCGHCVTHYCHPCSNVPPSPSGDAYVVDFESSLFVTHVATCPHRPAAMLTLWTSSPPFLSPTWQHAPIAQRQCLRCGLRVLPFCHPRGKVPPLPGGGAYVADIESPIFCHPRGNVPPLTGGDACIVEFESSIFCHLRGNVPPSPGGDAYVVDFESSIFVTHMATSPHRPAAVLMLWTSSPPFS